MYSIASQAFTKFDIVRLAHVDIQDIRRKRLAQFISGLGQKNSIERFGISASYSSQLVRGQASFGERAARSIEQKIGKPVGWLDGERQPTNETVTEEEQELLTLWRHIEPSEREPLLRELRGKVEGYKRAAAHLAKMGVKLDAPDEHDFPFKLPSKKR